MQFRAELRQCTQANACTSWGSGLCSVCKTSQRRLLVLNTCACAAVADKLQTVDTSRAALQALIAACLVVLASVVKLRCVMLELLCKHYDDSAMTV